MDMNAPIDLAHWAQDTNPEETAEWREALLSLLVSEGPERVNQILNSLTTVARQHSQPVLCCRATVVKLFKI